MNVFYLDHDPIVAAQLQNDKHVVKMVLESAQLLSTAHHIHSSEHKHRVYSMTHVNHPSAIWARSNAACYDWLARHMSALADEYRYRYGREHECMRLMPYLWCNPCPVGALTQPPQCMPDACKVQGDSVAAYRNYYRLHKRTYTLNGRPRLNSWTKRQPPTWMGIE